MSMSVSISISVSISRKCLSAREHSCNTHTNDKTLGQNGSNQ